MILASPSSSPDGVPTGETESGVGNPFLFQGLGWDGNRILSRRRRCVDPQVGRALKPKIAKGVPWEIFAVRKTTRGVSARLITSTACPIAFP